MSRVINEIEVEERTVSGVAVTVVELVWSDGGRSFDVRRVDTGHDLTMDESFDTIPSDEQIAALLDGWVTVYHNIASDEKGRRSAGLDGFQAGHELLPVWESGRWTDRSVVQPEHDDPSILEKVWELLNVGDDPSFGRPDPSAVEYRRRRNRSLSVGDVARISQDRWYQCAAIGWQRLDAAPQVSSWRQSVHGTTPLGVEVDQPRRPTNLTTEQYCLLLDAVRAAVGLRYPAHARSNLAGVLFRAVGYGGGHVMSRQGEVHSTIAPGIYPPIQIDAGIAADYFDGQWSADAGFWVDLRTGVVDDNGGALGLFHRYVSPE